MRPPNNIDPVQKYENRSNFVSLAGLEGYQRLGSPQRESKKRILKAYEGQRLAVRGKMESNDSLRLVPKGKHIGLGLA